MPRVWPFASGNFRGVAQALKTYSGSRWLPWLLFCGVLCSQLLVVCLYWWAVISSGSSGSLNWTAIKATTIRRREPDTPLRVWAAFMLADEILKQYDVEHSHVLFFMAQLVTFVSFYVLPS